jgi:hypothetical protein
MINFSVEKGYYECPSYQMLKFTQYLLFNLLHIIFMTNNHIL